MPSSDHKITTPAEFTIPFELCQLALYRCGSEACIYHACAWPLPQGRGRWGEFPLVVVRKHYLDLGYEVLASEPRLGAGKGFILLSYPGYRKARNIAYTQMAELLGTDLTTLDALNLVADKAKIAATGNRAGGDPDLFVFKADGSERFFVEAKYKDNLNRKQDVTFPIIRTYGWKVKIVRITSRQ